MRCSEKLADYLARTPEPNLRMRHTLGDRSPECVAAYNEYMREYMATVYRPKLRARRNAARLFRDSGACFEDVG
jgi:hypothetical protein